MPPDQGAAWDSAGRINHYMAGIAKDSTVEPGNMRPVPEKPQGHGILLGSVVMAIEGALVVGAVLFTLLPRPAAISPSRVSREMLPHELLSPGEQRPPFGGLSGPYEPRLSKFVAAPVLL